MARKQEKKSETLEIRLSYSMKTAFTDACRADGKTASDTLRGYIAAYLQQRSNKALRTQRFAGWPSPLLFSSISGVGAIAVSFCLFLLAPTDAANPFFSVMDTNDDGYLTAGDATDASREALFSLLEKSDTNTDGRLSTDEFALLPSFTVVLDTPPAGQKPKFLSVRLPRDATLDAKRQELALKAQAQGFDDAALDKILLAFDQAQIDRQIGS